jgi:hypothetical protein
LNKRNIFKVEENTSLSSIFYTFCKKNELESNNYSLKDSKGKSLDMSLTIRMLNIKNNAVLEIVKDSKKKNVSNNAVVVVDLGESGKHQDTFDMDTTIFDFILHW